MLRDFARDDQKHLIDDALNGKFIATFGLTEPEHGSDATHMDTTAIHETRDGEPGWRINGEKMWTTGMYVTHMMCFARTSGKDGDARGISCLLFGRRGGSVLEYLWTFNMPTDHPRVSLRNMGTESTIFDHRRAVWPSAALCSRKSHPPSRFIRRCCAVCIDDVHYARARKPFGKSLAVNQAIQFH